MAHILPYAQGLGRVITPDLIGMGDSEKLPDSGPGSSTFVEHRRYKAINVEKIVPESTPRTGNKWFFAARS